MIPAGFFATLKPQSGSSPVNAFVNLTGQSASTAFGSLSASTGLEYYTLVSTGGGDSVPRLAKPVVGGTWPEYQIFPATTGSPNQIVISPNGRYLCYGTTDSSFGNLVVIDLFNNWTMVTTGISLSFVPISQSFTRDSSQLVISRGPNPDIVSYSTSDWSTVASKVETDAQKGACSPSDDIYVVTLSASPWIRTYDTTDWTTTTGPSLGQLSNTSSLKFSPQGTYLAVGLPASPYIKVWRTSDWSLVTISATISNPVLGVSFSNDESRMIVGLDSSAAVPLKILETTTWTALSGVVPPTNCESIADSAWSANDSIVVVQGDFSDSHSAANYYNQDWSTSTFHAPQVVASASGLFFQAEAVPQSVNVNLTGQVITSAQGTVTVSAEQNFTELDRTSDAYWEGDLDFDPTATWDGTKWVCADPFVIPLSATGSWTTPIRPIKVSVTVTGLVGTWTLEIHDADGGTAALQSGISTPTYELSTTVLNEAISTLWVSTGDTVTGISNITMFVVS